MRSISIQRVLQNPYREYTLYGIGSEGSGYISSMEGTNIPHFLKTYSRSLKNRFHSIRFYEDIGIVEINKVFEGFDIYIDDTSNEMTNFLQKDSESKLDIDWDDIRANMPKGPVIWDSMEALAEGIKNHHAIETTSSPFSDIMSYSNPIKEMDSFVKKQKQKTLSDSLEEMVTYIKKEHDVRIPIDLREAKIYDIRDEVLSGLTINWEMITQPRSEIIVTRLLLKRLNEVFTDVEDYNITVSYDPSTVYQFDVTIDHK